ncbi:MAG: 4Fe-4S binding protein [Pseudobutyrivibrio sp.]|nr:4Fe-4S binding protein [Pseudobutyrivibrio sp.]
MGQFLPFYKQVFKNLFSKPATTQYPFKPKEYPERTRGHIEINKDQCILCGMCMRSCPPGAINVDRAGKTWTINRFDCIQCGYCAEKCPKKCLSIIPGYQEPGAEKFAETVEVPYEPPKPAAKPAAPAAGAAAKPAAANANTATTAAPANAAEKADEAKAEEKPAENAEA